MFSSQSPVAILQQNPGYAAGPEKTVQRSVHHNFTESHKSCGFYQNNQKLVDNKRNGEVWTV